jgi:peptidoglycan-associated lipoprotein
LEVSNLVKLTRALAVAALAVISISGVACKKNAASAPPPAPAPVVAAAPAPEPAAAPTLAPQPKQAVAQTPRSRYPDAATIKQIEELLARIQDAYFDYDKHMLRKDAQATLADDSKTLSDILKQYPDYKLTVEGHCDERGSAEYNMALGDARSKVAKEYLVSLGIPGDQLQTVSLGKERPVCTEPNEACYQKNRRAHIVARAQ